ncbi:MAG: threonylcarbamoyl-AMP synthase [Lachnospiraceae bacterium]|nr:threonylcarbamoyl-AMP synthase [Lachnospiraceae bacterium]
MKTKMQKADKQGTAVAEAGRVLREGGLVAFPTETVYGLGGNALDAGAAEKIYAAKGRPSDNPLIVHIARMESVYELAAEVPETAKKLMDAFWPGPLTIIFRKAAHIPYETTGGLETVGIRLPDHPVAQALIEAAGVPVAAPSANTSGRPSPTTAEHVWEDMEGKIDWILDGGSVGIGVESTIIDVTGEVPMILRPGYVTKEMAEAVIGPVTTDAAVTRQVDETVRPKAPGMKYRHYAPKAPLTIVEGEQRAVVARINALTDQAIAKGKRCGVIATDETQALYKQGSVLSVGSRSSEESIAHNLYAVLRAFDAEGVDVIYSEGFQDDHLGSAIMNRLRKAAGHKEIYVNS